MEKWIRRLTRIELVLIYLVILAGSVVRMTGSGMGCPDWPKCFGYLIPPTEKTQLEWQPQKEFKKGQIIIVNEKLRVANSDFVTTEKYKASNWEPYTKHNYALFNPFHTWTEYINRLLGALSGIPMFILFVLSLLYLKKNWRYTALSTAGLFLLGFEAWLGKLVVDGNLIPGSITIHMLGALSIVAVLVLIFVLTNKNKQAKTYSTPRFRNLLWIALIATLVQITLGTQVREAVDFIFKANLPRKSWIFADMDWEFYVHRSFSIAVLGVNVWLWYLNRKLKLGHRFLNPLMAILLAEIAAGVILVYFHLPKAAQPVHLLLGAMLFGLQWYGTVKYTSDKKTNKNFKY